MILHLEGGREGGVLAKGFLKTNSRVKAIFQNRCGYRKQILSCMIRGRSNMISHLEGGGNFLIFVTFVEYDLIFFQFQ